MQWGEAALWWAPTASVLVMAAVAVVAAATQSARPARAAWLSLVVLVGVFALAVSIWQQWTSRAVLQDEAARLRTVGERLDELGKLLPSTPGTTPGETFDTVTAAIVSLNAKIKELEGQIEALKEKARNRTIAPDVAGKIADYLRQFGPYRVVLSCVPDDVEAYDYANQIANVLRSAGWDAQGPETTTIFGSPDTLGIMLYVRSGFAPPDSAKVLIDAFTRFNIPYRGGVTPSDALPDPATVELFVGHKP
jgi:hypothetical protein